MENNQTAAEVNEKPGNGDASQAEEDMLDEAAGALVDWARTYAPDLAPGTLAGDLRDEVLDILRELREPWHKLTEKQQAFFATRVQDQTRILVGRAVQLIAGHDFPTIVVSLEQIAFKPKGIEAKLAMNAIDRATRHQLVDAQGKPVLIVVADPAAFLRARGAPKIDRDAPGLPLDAPTEGGAAVGTLPEDEKTSDAFAEADAADLSRPANRGHEMPPHHMEAQKIGKEDGLGGHQDNAARWPAGEYGHADYHVGHALGENERSALLLTARELGAVAGKAGEDQGSNPYHPGSAQFDKWLEGWVAPEPGNNGGHVEPTPKTAAEIVHEMHGPLRSRRGRPRKDDPGRQDRSL